MENLVTFPGIARKVNKVVVVVAAAAEADVVVVAEIGTATIAVKTTIWLVTAQRMNKYYIHANYGMTDQRPGVLNDCCNRMFSLQGIVEKCTTDLET